MRKYIDKYEKLFSDIGIVLLFICILFLSINKAKSQLHCTLNTVQTTQYLSQVKVAHNPQWVAALNQFVISEINDNNFYLLDRLYVFANDNQQSARVSLVNPTSTTITVYSALWTQYQGYKGNGYGDYINTNFTASLNGVNFTQNSACMGVYCNSASLTGSVEVDFGSQNGTIMNQYWVPTLKSFTNCGSAIGGQSYTKGMVVSVRTSSILESAWINGTQVASGGYSSSGVSSVPTYIMTQDLSNAPQSGVYSYRQYAMFFCGGGSINQLKLYTDWANFMNSL